nr:hypothetical protein B11C_100016 [Bartonella sp. 1-1C]
MQKLHQLNFYLKNIITLIKENTSNGFLKYRSILLKIVKDGTVGGI